VRTAWEQQPLGAVVAVASGQVDPKEAPYSTMPHIGGENIEAATGRLLDVSTAADLGLISGKYLFGPTDVLYSKIRPRLNKVVAPTFEGICSADIYPLRPRSGRIAREFLVHLLRSADFLSYAERHSSRTNIPKLNREGLLGYEVALPPLDEQRRIAEVLDRAEALRAKRRAALAQLDTLTQSIFLDLFGDPVANPRQWPDPKLGPLLSFQQYGPRFYNESYSDDGVRIVRITDLDEAGNLDFSQMPRMRVSDSDLAKYQLKPGDLVFARTGATVGKVALVQPGDPPCIAGAYFITMRFNERITPIYARAVLASPTVRSIITGRSRQAAQQNFSGPGLRELPLPIPPMELQLDFARRCAAVEKLQSCQRRSLAELDALFASLQHRAFRGEL
jgi:type I restriction enzyme, S subunit